VSGSKKQPKGFFKVQNREKCLTSRRRKDLMGNAFYGKKTSGCRQELKGKKEGGRQQEKSILKENILLGFTSERA